MPRIVSFGEIMLRLTPPYYRRFSQSPLFEVGFGGSEANVAVSLANYGLQSEFVSCLPMNRIADTCIDDLCSFGVDTSHILRAGSRIGLYYMEKTVALRASSVVYDRAGSSFDTLCPGEIDWDTIFTGATWFHWSGIAAAVSANTAAVCAEALASARRHGLTISCDINYRKNLWQYGKTIDEVLPPLMEQCDILFGTENEYNKALGTRFPKFEAQNASYRPDAAGYEAAARSVSARFPNIRAVIFALRNELSANHHLISGSLYTGEKLYLTRVYDIDNVVDCVGVGDAFVGGIIYGMAAHPNDVQYALDFGAAACALKNTVPGDYSRFTTAEIEQLAAGPVTGRIAR